MTDIKEPQSPYVWKRMRGYTPPMFGHTVRVVIATLAVVATIAAIVAGIVTGVIAVVHHEQPSLPALGGLSAALFVIYAIVRKVQS